MLNEQSRNDLAILFIRLGAGGFMLTHGYPKLMKLIAGGDIVFADPIGLGMLTSLILAVFAEFVCSILVVIGLKTRLAAIPLAVTMGVAAFIVHAADPLNRKELALIYLVMYVALIFSGSGNLSVDKILKKK